MKHLVALLTLIMAVSCRPHRHDGGNGHGAADERPALSFTHWTEATELFIDLPALVRGQESACAVHLTKLDGFSAITEGRVTVVLRSDSGEERFDSQAPHVPGIFRPIARPTSTGNRRLIVEVRAQGLSEDHDLGEVTIFENVAAARTALPAQPTAAGRITFLKEQQWPIAFGTATVAERLIRPMLRATGSVRARSDGEVVMTAPVAGRVATSGRTFPRIGERVEVSDLLGVLSPRLEAADLASLELAVTSANLESRFAERERQRIEALRTEGAVPDRRVQDAVHAAEEAQASLAAAQRRLAQFRGVQRTAGLGEGTVQLRAPLSGTVTEVHVAPGAFVEAGVPLFRVTDITQLWIEARVPESDVGRLGMPRGASFLIEGFDEAIELPIEALVARGHVIDPVTRTLPLVFAVDNASGRLPIGAFARVFIVNGDERRAVAVPESSLVDDSGAPVVFVQVAGEAFDRRPVRLGARDRGQVEVVSGVRVGERVVTRGAWSVKLAASSGSIPAHGHSH